jgi:hypothetical protein
MKSTTKQNFEEVQILTLPILKKEIISKQKKKATRNAKEDSNSQKKEPSKCFKL